MKKIKALLLLSFVLYLQFSLCYSQGKDGLVAAPYLGSIPEPPVELNSRTFYTKDRIEKVMAHYTKSLGAFEDRSQNSYFREAIPSNDVMEYLAKQGIQMGESRVFAGVTLYGKPISYNGTVNTVMDKLKSAYLMRFNNGNAETIEDVTKHLDDAELKQTLARYEHVKWEHFPLSNGKHMDEVVYEKQITTPENAVTKEQQELSTKMQQLMVQMKYDEATKVGDRMTQLSALNSDAKWNWGLAIKCLQELEKNAYATKIVIDKHPSQWDLSTWK